MARAMAERHWLTSRWIAFAPGLHPGDLIFVFAPGLHARGLSIRAPGLHPGGVLIRCGLSGGSVGCRRGRMCSPGCGGLGFGVQARAHTPGGRVQPNLTRSMPACFLRSRRRSLPSLRLRSGAELSSSSGLRSHIVVRYER